MAEETPTLSELRNERTGSFAQRFKKLCPWLFDLKSLFYFFWFVFLLGVAWMFYSLINNSGTQLYGWDYTWQWINFSYNFWDIWRNFFKTGVFEFYDTATFFGTDNIGSNSYYGLFDPFSFLCVLFPRAWVPQIYALGAILKGVVGAFTMRAYLKYMGCKESSSRLGAIAFAYCGYLNFMVGFPSTVSMVCTVPLILLGIEKIIKERKPSCLIWGLFLLGIISFFFLVVICIFGVMYAIWRYLWTIKTRTAKDNWIVITMGVAGFAIGICMSAWTLLPSIRETSLSGRTISIGRAYLDTLVTAFQGQDFGTIFSMLFATVGGNPARELMGLVSFFYPTCNYLWLPLYMGGTGSYDAWTSSLFCYTPMIILFFLALLGSIRRKKWSHLIAIAICAYFVFTIFAYFFFYAFTGDGYGRWFIVLVPLIIYYGCQEFDHIREEPSWQLPTATLISCAMTVLTFVLVTVCIKGQTFINDNNFTYWASTYTVPSYVLDSDGIVQSCEWLVFYQMALVVIESGVMIYLQNKEYLWKVLIGFIAVETIVCGNISFGYGSSWSYQYSLNGGATSAAEATQLFSDLNDYDSDSYYRCYSDDQVSTNDNLAFGYNGSATFHSLYNFGIQDLGHYSHFIANDTSFTSYDETIVSKVWSGYYGNKRFALDEAAGFKYYVIQNEGYGTWDNDDFAEYNVPFGSTCILKTDQYRVYKSPYAFSLGHAVDSDKLYYEGTTSSDTPNLNSFYSNAMGSTGYKEIMRNEELYLDGAIVDNDAVLPDGLSASSFTDGYTNIKMEDISSSIVGKIYTTVDGYGYGYNYNGETTTPASFLTDSTLVDSKTSQYSRTELINKSYARDDDKVVLYPSTGTYFNTDTTGAYFLMNFNGTSSTRIYMIGDTYNADGTTKATNVVLNYEYHMIDNWASSGERGYTDYSGLFGFYAAGRVKYIVFCAKGSGTASMPSYLYLYKMERSDLEAEMAKLNSQEYALSDVEYSTDRFTFSTDYSATKMVVTTIGYDEGWHVKATAADGTVTYPSMYRLDGGFVGFAAPSGEVSYVLYYETPYFKLGTALAVTGFGIYIGYEVVVFVVDVRHYQKELDLVNEKRPSAKKKRKDEKDEASMPEKPKSS
jgi:hypothetical protein